MPGPGSLPRGGSAPCPRISLPRAGSSPRTPAPAAFWLQMPVGVPSFWLRRTLPGWRQAVLKALGMRVTVTDVEQPQANQWRRVWLGPPCFNRSNQKFRTNLRLKTSFPDSLTFPGTLLSPRREEGPEPAGKRIPRAAQTRTPSAAQQPFTTAVPSFRANESPDWNLLPASSLGRLVCISVFYKGLKQIEYKVTK